MITRHKFLDKNTTPYILIHLYIFFNLFPATQTLSSFHLRATIPTPSLQVIISCVVSATLEHTPSGHQPPSPTPSIPATPSTTTHTRLQIKSPFLSSPQTRSDRPPSSAISLLFSFFSASLFYRSLSYANFSPCDLIYRTRIGHGSGTEDGLEKMPWW